MSPHNGKFNNIGQIVWIRHLLRRWRKKAASSSTIPRITDGRVPSDVPAGHLAVSVGNSHKRYVVKATHLNHPIFQELLIQAEEEYGFANEGPLFIPCEEAVFEEILGLVSGDGARLEEFMRSCHGDFRMMMSGVDGTVDAPRTMIGGGGGGGSGMSNKSLC